MQRDSGRRAVVAVGVAVAVAVVGGCSSRATPPDGDGTPTSDPVVFFFDGAVEGVTSDETITGTVVLVDGCVGLLADGQEHLSLVVWPPGARWDAEHDAVEMPNGSVPVGTDLTHSRGQLHTLEEATENLFPEPPQECLEVAGSITFLTQVDDIGGPE